LPRPSASLIFWCFCFFLFFLPLLYLLQSKLPKCRFFWQHNLCVFVILVLFVILSIYSEKKGLIRQKKGLIRQKKGLVRQKERFSPSKKRLFIKYFFFYFTFTKSESVQVLKYSLRACWEITTAWKSITWYFRRMFVETYIWL